MKKGLQVVLASITGIIIGALGVGCILTKGTNLQDSKVQKYKDYYAILNQWLLLKYEKRSLAEYFIKNNYKTVAIYGMGELGSRFIEEIRESEIEIKYAIDMNTNVTNMGINIVNIEDTLDEVDVIVVTATFAFNEIERKLKDRIKTNIVSLEEVVFDSMT